MASKFLAKTRCTVWVKNTEAEYWGQRGWRKQCGYSARETVVSWDMSPDLPPNLAFKLNNGNLDHLVYMLGISE